MKKRIFILGHWMKIDGVATSLLGLLKSLDYSRVEVDLMLMSVEGELREEIPSEVNLLKTHPAVAQYWGSKCARYASAKILHIVALCVAGVWYRLLRRMKIDKYGLSLISGFLFCLILPRRIVPDEYDLALFFSCEPFLVGRVNARKSVVWVHSDFGMFSPVRYLLNLGFGRADYIVNVSVEAKASFDRYLTCENKKKSIVVENCISQSWIKSKANAFDVEKGHGLRILSVGRVSPPKNYFRALEAAKILAARGASFTWIVVGNGESLNALKSAVENAELDDSFQMVGLQTNPYPYYEWCDLLVCTSDWEGKSVAVREAQIFAKPVVVTKFPTAASQVEDGVDGLLVDRTPEAVAEGIIRLMDDSALREKLSANCRRRDYTNLGEIDKILAL